MLGPVHLWAGSRLGWLLVRGRGGVSMVEGGNAVRTATLDSAVILTPLSHCRPLLPDPTAG